MLKATRGVGRVERGIPGGSESFSETTDLVHSLFIHPPVQRPDMSRWPERAQPLVFKETAPILISSPEHSRHAGAI